MSKALKFAFIALFLFILIVIICYVYRMFFQFKMATVKSLAMQYANNTANPVDCYKIIINGCQDILFSIDRTEQIKIMAQNDNMSPEQELVNAAINNAIASGFISPT